MSSQILFAYSLTKNRVTTVCLQLPKGDFMGAELSFIGTKLSAHYSQLQSVSIGLPLAAADLVVGL